MKIQYMWHDPYIIIIKDLLYDHECDKITKSLGDKLVLWNGERIGKREKHGLWSDVRVMKK